MSDVKNETPATEPTTTQQPETTTEEVSKAEPTSTDAPATEPAKTEETPAAAEESKEETAAEEKKDEAAPAAEKTVEPITEGQLAFKGPGLLKSIIPSKKECWLSEEATSSQDLNSYMRGEKPEISHPVVAWASQTGKGLLFFNKKGDTTKKQPGHVLALYDASGLKKQEPHEIVFHLQGEQHILKAATQAERDGWFMSLEKTIEEGKASKDEIRESEGYKTEMEKLNKPHVAATASAVAAKRSQSQPEKKTETDKPADKGEEAQRKNSDLEDEDKKKNKSRSTSRGIFNRVTGKKEEAKPEEKKEEKKEEPMPEEESKTEEVGAAAAGTAAVAGAAGVAAHESSEDKNESTESPAEKTEEKSAKPAKRGSIFGKMQAGLGSMRSPTKEKDQKDAELKPEVPPKDAPVSQEPPQLPETTKVAENPTVEAEQIKADAEAKADAEQPKEKEQVSTPNKEKSGFLSGLPFMNKRNRSVSPSQPMKEAPAKIETTEAAKEEPTVEAANTEEPTTEAAAATESTDKSAEKTEEPAKTDKAAPSNKRQSVIGQLGRRASKAMNNMRPQKKENAAPGTEAKKEETTAAAAEEDKPTVNGESKPAEQTQQSIGDVVPDAINVGQPQQAPTVTASA